MAASHPGDLAELVTSPGAYAFAAVLGALFGSFANVCILRIPAGKSIVHPGSHCFACGAPVRWYDNLPIVSYLVLRGRCRRCRAGFSPRYLFVELATMLLVVAAWRLDSASIDDPLAAAAHFGVHALFILCLVVITFIDLDHKLIPDVITYPGIPIFLGLGVLLGDRPVLDLAIGALAGYGVVRLLSDGYYWLTKREGMGYGDGKLLALVGGLLGWQGVLFSLFGGSLVGTFVALPLIALSRLGQKNKEKNAESFRHLEIPFGPFLVAGALVYLFLEKTVEVGFGLG